ncbi:MAG: mevalonate kinase family protein [Candidatus Heimdallarchaeaceae archaeon]|jgi:galactokinase
MEKIAVSTPGRICLFGEDLDYLGLEVITVAINQRINVIGEINDSGSIKVKLEDMNQIFEFKNEKQKIQTKREYVKSAFNLYQEFLPPNFGANIIVNSNLLIGKGLSSSSAFAAALVGFFDKAANINSKEKDIARNAYLAEVVNLGEPGGMMDHYASVIGNVIYLECQEPFHFEKLDVKLEGLVIGDTLKRKETIETITLRKQEIMSAIEIVKKKNTEFSLKKTSLKDVLELYEEINNPNLKRLIAVLGIRDVVKNGFEKIKNNQINRNNLADLINKHHYYQQNYFENVTEKMQTLIHKAKEAGALGCKLLGSGNGGSFLAYAPEKENAVADAIVSNGGEAYQVNQDRGISIS